jgi:hypothetical protein
VHGKIGNDPRRYLPEAPHAASHHSNIQTIAKLARSLQTTNNINQTTANNMNQTTTAKHVWNRSAAIIFTSARAEII